MINNKLNNDEKQLELQKYRALVLATLDYYLDHKEYQFQTPDFDSIEHYKGLKTQTEDHFQKGRLTRLKQWFRDLIEMVETGDLKFNKYLKDKTKYEIDIFRSYFHRVDKVIAKGKITTDNQFYDINMMVDQLCQTEPVDNKKIEILNKLLSAMNNEKYNKETNRPHNNEFVTMPADE